MERKKPGNLRAKIIRHPDWCDQQKCAITIADLTGETHRSATYMMTLPGLLSTITITAELSKANAPWLTETYIEIEWAGLLMDGWSPVTGTATIPSNRIGELLQALSGLAARAVADQNSEIAESLVRPRSEVK